MSCRLAWLAGILLLAMSGPLSAADGPAGRWKFRIPEGEQTITFLLNFAVTDGKWTGDFIGSSARLQREPQFSSLTVENDQVRFALTFNGREFLNFDGVLAKDGSKITGSVSQFGGPLRLTELYPSKLKKLDDPVELAKETVAQVESGPELFDAGMVLMNSAGGKKLPADEVRSVADKLTKAASVYGSRWERTVALKLATTLANQPAYADIALAQARRVERMIGDDAPTALQIEVADTLGRVLTQAGKADEAKKYTAQVQKLQARDYAEFQKTALNFPQPEYKGRKEKSDRAVVFEIFTGSEAPPSTAVELAALGLMKTFKPTEVIVLQYHVHAPAPDALANNDGMERVGIYQKLVRNIPTVIVDGKAGPQGGGAAAAAKDKYAEFRELTEKELEIPAKAKIELTATPGEKGTAVKAVVTTADMPADKTVLRFVLVEDVVRFAGASGLRYHHNVVRALPGGVNGFPLKGKSLEQTVTIDRNDLRTKLGQYLDDFAKNEAEFPRSDRPLDLKGLKLVAIVQNDATGEILQAAQIDLK